MNRRVFLYLLIALTIHVHACSMPNDDPSTGSNPPAREDTTDTGGY